MTTPLRVLLVQPVASRAVAQTHFQRWFKASALQVHSGIAELPSTQTRVTNLCSTFILFNAHRFVSPNDFCWWTCTPFPHADGLILEKEVPFLTVCAGRQTTWCITITFGTSWEKWLSYSTLLMQRTQTRLYFAVWWNRNSNHNQRRGLSIHSPYQPDSTVAITLGISPTWVHRIWLRLQLDTTTDIWEENHYSFNANEYLNFWNFV